MNLKQWIMWMVFTCFIAYGTYIYAKDVKERTKGMSEEECFWYLKEYGTDYVHQTMFGIAWACVLCGPMMIEYFAQ